MHVKTTCRYANVQARPSSLHGRTIRMHAALHACSSPWWEYFTITVYRIISCIDPHERALRIAKKGNYETSVFSVNRFEHASRWRGHGSSLRDIMVPVQSHIYVWVVFPVISIAKYNVLQCNSLTETYQRESSLLQRKSN